LWTGALWANAVYKHDAPVRRLDGLLHPSFVEGES
jgi:hypothetical protein